MAEGTGKLQVVTFTGFRIFPLAEVTVQIRSEEGENSRILAVRRTDASGKSPLIDLPVKGISDDPFVPNSDLYTVETYKKGFQAVILHGVKVFDGVTTVQNINMVALPEPFGGELTEYDQEQVLS